MPKRTSIKKAGVALQIAIEESRGALFSDWSGQLQFNSAAWGAVVATGPGFSQNHADLLDFSRMFYRDISFDSVGRATLLMSFADFARFKGIKPDSGTHKAQLLDFLHTSIAVCTPDGRITQFIVCDRARYLNERNPLQKPIPPKKGKNRRDENDYKEHNRECAPRPGDGLFEFRLTSEFQAFLSTSMSVDYSEFLHHIVRLSDVLKRASRFFLSHMKWNCSTENLYYALYPTSQITEQMAENEVKRIKIVEKKRKSRKSGELRAGAQMLEEFFGIRYDAGRDHWFYDQHPLVRISKPWVDPKTLLASKSG